MFIQELPEGLIKLVEQKLEKSKKEEQQPKKVEEVVVNPTIDSPHSVRTQ